MAHIGLMCGDYSRAYVPHISGWSGVPTITNKYFAPYMTKWKKQNLAKVIGIQTEN